MAKPMQPMLGLRNGLARQQLIWRRNSRRLTMPTQQFNSLIIVEDPNVLLTYMLMCIQLIPFIMYIYVDNMTLLLRPRLGIPSPEQLFMKPHILMTYWRTKTGLMEMQMPL